MITPARYVFFVPVFVLCAVLAVSCKKAETPAPAPPVPTASRADLTRDSIFLYAREVYLWSDALPTYDTFRPRSYSSSSTDLTNFSNEVFALSQYKINSSTSQPYEYAQGRAKYSYISDRTAANPVAVASDVPAGESSVDLEGNGNDFGFALTALTNAQNTTYGIYVRYVSPGSPAAKAGLHRGNIISKINDTAYGDNFNAESPAINTALGQNSITLTLKSTGASFTLAKSVYKSSPVYSAKVIDTLGVKIGYLSYARFSSMENSQAELLQAFNTFASSGVTDLVIDLRYNGGGYVVTSQYLGNLIVPSRISGSTMFVEYYNSLMQARGAKILANQPLLDGNDKIQYSNGKIITYADVDYSPAKYTFKFAKEGNFDNLRNVVFIVTAATASASELLINNLKPYVNVKLVGTQTYGKPVGFFPIKIDKYDLYLSMFQSKNSANEGDYFSGMPVDQNAFDDVRYDFGDTHETSLAYAIAYLKKGSFVFSTSSAKGVTVSGTAAGISAAPLGNSRSFKGSIETRFTLKK